MQSRQEPVLELPLAAGSQIAAMAFNPKQRGLLSVGREPNILPLGAAGDNGGRVRVFRLPFRLSEQQKSEAAGLERGENH